MSNWIFGIRGGATQFLNGDMEPHDIQVIDFSYDIIAQDVDDEREDVEEKAGELHGFVLEFDGKEELFEAADSHSQQAYDVWELVYGGKETNGDGYYSPRFMEAIGCEADDLMCGRVVHIELVTVMPKFRGQNVGLRAIWGALHIHEGRLVTLNAFPLQFSADWSAEQRAERDALGLDGFTKDQNESTKKLQQYYAMMGFQKIKPIKLSAGYGYGSWMYIDNDYTRPHLDDLVPEPTQDQEVHKDPKAN